MTPVNEEGIRYPEAGGRRLEGKRARKESSRVERRGGKQDARVITVLMALAGRVSPEEEEWDERRREEETDAAATTGKVFQQK